VFRRIGPPNAATVDGGERSMNAQSSWGGVSSSSSALSRRWERRRGDAVSCMAVMVSPQTASVPKVYVAHGGLGGTYEGIAPLSTPASTWARNNGRMIAQRHAFSPSNEDARPRQRGTR
jgi:hypothetical protein